MILILGFTSDQWRDIYKFLASEGTPMPKSLFAAKTLWNECSPHTPRQVCKLAAKIMNTLDNDCEKEAATLACDHMEKLSLLNSV